MDQYRNDKNSALYLVHYEIEDNKIVEHYMDGSKFANIPNISHNIDLCERRLMSQFQGEKKIQSDRGNLWIGRKTLEITAFGVAVTVAFLEKSYPLVFLDGLLFLNSVRDAREKIQGINRFRLTDYCLTHAASLKFSENERDASYGLSEKGKKAFRLDHGFKLNHAHLYTNKDLKQLKKVIGN